MAVRMQLKEDPECEWLKFTRLCWGVSIPGQKGLMCQWDSSAAASELTFDPWGLPSPGNQSLKSRRGITIDITSGKQDGM